MHASAKGSHPCPGPRTPSLSSLGRQLGKNKSGLSVMHPGKKSVSSLITASSVVQGGSVCKCMWTRCFQVQTSVQEDSLTCGMHRHTYVCAHLSGWAPANGMWTRSNRQHAFIQSCPKLSAEECTHVCVYFIWCMKTHTYVLPSFLIYIHTCFIVTYLHERSSAGKKVWLPLRRFNLIKATGKIKTKNKNTPTTNKTKTTKQN